MATEPGMVEFSLFCFFLFYFIFEHFPSTQKHVGKVFQNGCTICSEIVLNEGAKRKNEDLGCIVRYCLPGISIPNWRVM